MRAAGAGSPPPRTQERRHHERPALRDVEAVGRLALTWLDNGGAPAAMTSVIRHGNAKTARIPERVPGDGPGDKRRRG